MHEVCPHDSWDHGSSKDLGKFNKKPKHDVKSWSAIMKWTFDPCKWD